MFLITPRPGSAADEGGDAGARRAAGQGGAAALLKPRCQERRRGGINCATDSSQRRAAASSPWRRGKGAGAFSAPVGAAPPQAGALGALQTSATLLLACEAFISAAQSEKLNHRGESED